MCQGTFTADVIRTLAGDYTLKPVRLGLPWPTIEEVSRKAAEAGLRHGDRVIAIEGRRQRGNADLALAVHERRPGDNLKITVDRAGKPLEIPVPLEAYRSWWSFALITLIFMPWLSILLGFWVAAMRPRDYRAWMVLGVLAGLRQLVRPDLIDPLGWSADIGPPRSPSAPLQRRHGPCA